MSWRHSISILFVLEMRQPDLEFRLYFQKVSGVGSTLAFAGRCEPAWGFSIVSKFQASGFLMI